MHRVTLGIIWLASWASPTPSLTEKRSWPEKPTKPRETRPLPRPRPMFTLGLSDFLCFRLEPGRALGPDTPPTEHETLVSCPVNFGCFLQGDQNKNFKAIPFAPTSTLWHDVASRKCFSWIIFCFTCTWMNSRISGSVFFHALGSDFDFQHNFSIFPLIFSFFLFQFTTFSIECFDFS